MNRLKSKLYRKVNTTAYGIHHNFGEDFKRYKSDNLPKMKRNIERGLDYTPLFKFLLFKVGSNWNEIFGEAKSRLDKSEPIFWMVARNDLEKKTFVRTGESTYFSGLFVDENNLLQKCDPDLNKNKMEKFCSCCTHTLNGEIY